MVGSAHSGERRPSAPLVTFHIPTSRIHQAQGTNTHRCRAANVCGDEENPKSRAQRLCLDGAKHVFDLLLHGGHKSKTLVITRVTKHGGNRTRWQLFVLGDTFLSQPMILY